VTKEKEKNWKRLGCVQSTSAQSGTPDSVRCARLVRGELAALGIRRWRTTIIHRTVRWANGRQRNSRPRNPRAMRGCSNGQLGAPDCPVRHSTKGKDSLPCCPPTAHSYLGAIKGTPTRMEESSKHSLSILRLPHPVSAHLIDCVSNLSPFELWTLCATFRAQVLACVCAADLCVVCVSLLALLFCILWYLYYKGERLQLVEITQKREKDYKEESRGIQVDHWITWKGLSATLVHWDATTWK
jgi:hypothetical protein